MRFIAQRLTAYTILGTFITFIGPYHWLLESHRNFASYYLVALVIVLPVFVLASSNLSKLLRIGTPVLIVLLIYLLVKPVTYFYKQPYSSTLGESTRTLSLLYANVNVESSEYSKFAKIISERDPDIVALLEVNESWLDALRLAGNYPHKVEIPFEHKFGLALYSKLPFTGEMITDLGEGLSRVVITGLQLSDDKEVLFTLLHAMPPVSQDALNMNRLLIRRAATYIRNFSGAVIAAGDFNATPYSGFYGIFMHGARLRHTAAGFGLYKSWNEYMPIFILPIDHVFQRSVGQVRKFETIPDFGSDHRALWVKFDIS